MIKRKKENAVFKSAKNDELNSHGNFEIRPSKAQNIFYVILIYEIMIIFFQEKLNTEFFQVECL